MLLPAPSIHTLPLARGMYQYDMFLHSLWKKKKKGSLLCIMYLKPRVKLYSYNMKKDTSNKHVGILAFSQGMMLTVGGWFLFFWWQAE